MCLVLCIIASCLSCEHHKYVLLCTSQVCTSQVCSLVYVFHIMKQFLLLTTILCNVSSYGHSYAINYNGDEVTLHIIIISRSI